MTFDNLQGFCSFLVFCFRFVWEFSCNSEGPVGLGRFLITIGIENFPNMVWGRFMNFWGVENCFGHD